MAKETANETADERADEAAATGGLSTAPVEEPEVATAVAGSFGGVREPGARGQLAWLGRELLGWARWFWRQLTSMRVALILLFLLALAAIPGSMIPQNNASPTTVQDFQERNPGLSSFYDRLQLFDVYSSVWFSAIYLLLFVSLVGCIIPRSWQFVGQLRGRPPRAPRRLDRMPAYTTWRTGTEPADVLDAAHRQLRRRRFRVDRREDDQPGRAHVAAEKGYLREVGNLVFHLSLVVLLIAFAAGRLYYAEGGKLVVEGYDFTNNLTQYDDFSSGPFYDTDNLGNFSFTLDEFHAEFTRSGPDLGTPSRFDADVTYRTEDGTERSTTIQVNEPLGIGDERVRLLGHGFAPVVRVTDGEGNTAFSGPVPFIPQDQALTSVGVIKVTDYVGPDGQPTQLGFQGFFSPTYNIDEVRGPHSTFPDPDDPVLTLTGYRGDLGIDSGLPQNVYQLDTTDMEQMVDAETGDVFRFDLRPGESVELPDDGGTLEFQGFERWATFQISTRAGNGWALGGSLAAIAGLAASLMLQRRRVWVRAYRHEDGHTVVEMASLGRTESGRIPEELASLAAALEPAAPMLPAEPEEGPGSDSPDPSAEESAAEGARS
ncbi:cytochrome c biogenesis protein ResB [Streptomyces millisiae]|uniref:Cytochrome c biogenesis protein ResB n=1 Tax=Streptomyces millisiae TaxID=3075542 RepID=A0ABU2LU99_9ACTN|nr:cytochrome c biogenesis protein ResB [Streptomyces sp. DSM 44918]MDT0321095.1 cytochrome c biogenesis protein ResB [Streptomyces sp. DSM 44918]